MHFIIANCADVEARASRTRRRRSLSPNSSASSFLLRGVWVEIASSELWNRIEGRDPGSSKSLWMQAMQQLKTMRVLIKW